MSHEGGNSLPDWIRQFPGLSRLDPMVRDVLIRKSAVVALPEGTVIFGPGKSPENLLLLLEGRVRVQQVSEGGARNRPLPCRGRAKLRIDHCLHAGS